MPQIVEYNGTRIEFPDGMAPSEIEAAIKKSALNLPSKAAQKIANDPITKGAQNFAGEMSGLQRFGAGMGKAFTDVGRGIGQLIPTDLSGNTLVSRQDVAESRKLDAPLMASGAGLSGNITGNVAALLPTAFIPGSATIPGAALIGAASGFLQPSTSNVETVKNTAVGGIAAPGAILAGRGVTALYQGAKGLIEPLTKRGQERIAASVLQNAATDAEKAAANAAQARPLVPGSQPTLAQVADDPGLAQLERTILNNPETAPALQQRFAAQRAARLDTVKTIAGKDDYYDAIKEGRRIFANEDYAKAIEQGIDPKMAKAMAPQLQSLLERPSIQRAQQDAIRLAKENGVSLAESPAGSLQGLDWVKKALDNRISLASQPGSSIGKEELKALLQTKSDLMATMEQLAPAYRVANDNFAAMSRQVNSMDVARSLMDKLQRPGSEYMGNSAREMGQQYSEALSKSVDSVKKATGMNLPLSRVMDTKDIAALEAVARDYGRKTFAENAGKAVGSPTAQNLASQNMLRRMLGPTGLPQSWAESTMLQSMLSPVQAVSKLTGADKRVMDRIAMSLLDPADAAGLLMIQPQVSRGLLSAPVQRMLPGVSSGLLGVQLKEQ